jgi:hypothetical protein
MRHTAIGLALGLLVAMPASASIILEAREFVVVGDRSASLRLNDLSDRILDDFTVLDSGASGEVRSSGRVLNRVSPGLDLLSGRLVTGGGSVLVTGSLVSLSSYGRRSFVWVGGAPAPTEPIPEPGSALLFVVGTGLVVASLRRLRA